MFPSTYNPQRTSSIQGGAITPQLTISPQRTGGLSINQSGTRGIPIANSDPRLGPDGKLGVFWVGTDNNIWTRDNQGKTVNMGPNGSVDVSQWRQVADWNTGGAGDSNKATAGSGGGVSYPDLSGAINMLRQNIDALDPVYQADVKKAIQAYDTANNERQSAYKKAQAANDSSITSNDQSVLQSRNAINKNTRTSSENILSILGALGMTGSTTKKALGTIVDKSNEGLNSTNYDYGKNKQSILQSWNDYVNEDANQQKQIEDAKAYNIAQAGISKNMAKKDYLAQIASNKINMGQGTDDILGEMAGVNKEIAALSNVPKTYTGVTPTYTAPSISSLLGQNLARFDVVAGTGAKKTAPRLIKVNEQTPSGDKYGIT